MNFAKDLSPNLMPLVPLLKNTSVLSTSCVALSKSFMMRSISEPMSSQATGVLRRSRFSKDGTLFFASLISQSHKLALMQMLEGYGEILLTF